MGIRIELIEKYVDSGQDGDDTLERLGLPVKRRYATRRVNVNFEDIERVIEIPENDDECKVRLYGGEELLVRECYDDMSQFITSLEHYLENEDEEE